MRRVAPLTAAVIVTLHANPARPCSSTEGERIAEVLMPLGPEVPTNVALFAVTPFRPTQIIVRQGDVVVEHESETGEIDIGVLDADTDYEVEVRVDDVGRILRFHTTEFDGVGPASAPTASAAVTTDLGGVSLPTPCESSLWRNASTTVDVDVVVGADAIVAVRVDDDGRPVERAGPDGFRFRSLDTANEARFAVVDAAGHVSPETQVEVRADSCAQTSSTSTATWTTLALAGLALVRRRRGTHR